ncbi:MAG: hypothetical protein VW881_00020 [Alphaproteobacteria bacterium]
MSEVNHVDDVADKIDLEGPPTYRRDINPLNDFAQDFCGLDATVQSIKRFMQVLDLAPIEFCEIGMKYGGGRRGHINLALHGDNLDLHVFDLCFQARCT